MELLTREQAAERLGISVSTLDNGANLYFSEWMAVSGVLR